MFPDYSIMDCPQITTMPLVMDTTTTKWKCSNMELAPNCPRCASTNTKFCYYNNYSLSQPRYFCKSCRRYWTKGGSLRNVPVGGGCRKSRRARASSRQIGPPGPTPSPGGATAPAPEPCIDLAAVFAKYVNQQNVELNNNNDNNNNNNNNNNINEESFSPGASSGSSDNYSQHVDDSSMFEALINGGDHDQGQRIGPEVSEFDGRGYVYEDFNGFDQQGMNIGDVVWSEEGTTLGNIGCEVQPVMQVEDFGLFSPDDQFRISANLMADNWGSFDPSAYEFFSNP